MTSESKPTKQSQTTKYLDFESQLLFYSQYHHNPINQWIHICCVPLLFCTALMMLECYQLGIVSNIAVAVYIVYYILLEPFAGTLYAPVLLGLWFAAKQLPVIYGTSIAFQYGAIVHVISWILQFVGHGVAEGRAPALLDGLVQALMTAPMFVWMEVLFMFGYRPKLKQRMEEKTKLAIQEWKKSSGAPSSTVSKKKRRAD